MSRYPRVNPHEIFERLFSNLGPPTPESRQHATALMRQLEANPDRDSFYLKLDIRQPPTIPWVCNLERVLGYRTLSYETYFPLIHDHYRGIYLEFGVAAYQLAKKFMASLPTENSAYSILVPLRHRLGSYIWIRQVSEPLEFDANGHMVSQLNTYRYVGEFTGPISNRPMVEFGATPRPDIGRQVSDIALRRTLESFLFELTEMHVNTALAYLHLYDPATNPRPTSEAVGQLLQRRVSTVHSYNKRILEEVRYVFPLSDFPTMVEFTKFLYLTFGKAKP
jgi:hypothetical protein